MIDVKRLKLGLSELQQSAEEHLQFWFLGESARYSSFDETVCQTFDDTGYSSYERYGELALYVSQEVIQAMAELSEAIDQTDHIPNGLSPWELLNTPEMAEVRSRARHALDVFNDDSDTET